MMRSPVASSNIAAIGYDEPSETLEIEFTSGAIYQYYNIGRATYEALMAAPSKGQFFGTYIKNAAPFSRVG